MKRNVLASFTDVLLMPVTIVPRAVGALVTTGGTAAVNGIAMLNPQRWVGGAKANQAQAEGYSTSFDMKMDESLFDEEEEEGFQKALGAVERVETAASRLLNLG